MSDDASDKRIHVRISTVVPCVVQSGVGLSEGRLLDLSRSGAQLEADLDVAESGEMIMLGLGLPEDTIAVQLKAEVVRKGAKGEGFWYGLRFSVLEFEARQKLYAFIEHLAGGDGGNRRDKPRFARRLEIELTTKEQLKSVMRDVSEGGIGLVTPVAVVLDEPVRIDVRIPGTTPLTLPGRVAYVHALKEKNFAVGVAFDQLKPETKAMLDQFIKSLAKG